MQKLVLLGVVAVALGSTIYAQRRNQTALNVDGISVHLGMPKQEFVQKLGKRDINKVAPDTCFIGKQGVITVPMVEFTNDRISYAELPWPTYDNDIADAYYGAVTALNQEGFKNCDVEAFTKMNPDGNSHSVVIACGEKSTLLTRLEMNGKHYNTISEQLGKENFDCTNR